MSWTRVYIRSQPNSGAPFYEFSVDEANQTVDITADKDTGTDNDMSGTTIDVGAISVSEPFSTVITESGTIEHVEDGSSPSGNPRCRITQPSTKTHYRLYKFSDLGVLLQKTGNRYDSPVNDAEDLSKKDGDYYLTDDANNEIHQLDGDFSITQTWDSPTTEPEGMDWDGSNWWLVDQDDEAGAQNSNVYKLDESFNILSSFETGFEGHSLEEVDGDLLVGGNLNGDVVRMDTQGNVKDTYDISNNSQQLSWDGELFWMTDQQNDPGNIFAFEPDGDIVYQTYIDGTSAHGIFYDFDKELMYVINRTLGVIYEYSVTRY